jgi:hypothetical protein
VPGEDVDEVSSAAMARQLITWRAGLEACRQVGELARPVSTVAAELGVCWWTVMNTVTDQGTASSSGHAGGQPSENHKVVR